MSETVTLPNPKHIMRMSEYMFGLGPGWLPKQVAKIARKHGAELVNYCDPGCKCGYGCHNNCPACRRHWFAGPNRGAPFDRQLADKVLTAVGQNGG